MPAWISVVALWIGAVEPTRSVMAEGACEDGDALRERLDALVPAEAPLGAVRLTAASGEGEVWQGALTFEVEGVAHERALSAESCAALYEASALVIGLAVQPMREEESAVPGPPEEAGATGMMEVPDDGSETEERDADALPRMEADAPGASEPDAVEVPPARLRVQVRAGAGVAVGVVHPVHPRITAGAALAGRRWATGLDLAYMPPLAAEVATETRAIVQVGALEARGCPVWRFADERVALPVCAGVAAGLAWGRGEGEAIEVRRGRESWASLVAGPRVELHARWGGLLWLATELWVPLRRLNFVIGPGEPACCQAPVGAVLSLGGGWTIFGQRN